MDSASPANLIRLLLRRSDRHPVATLDGLDLADHGAGSVDRLIEACILIECAPLELVDGMPVRMADGGAFVSCPSGRNLSEEVDPRTLRQFEIDMNRLCVEIRRANGFTGAPVERLSHRLFHLGDFEAGGRSRPVFLARLLRDDNALDTVLALRGRSDGKDIVLLVPTNPELTLETSRRVACEGVTLVAMTESLRPNGQEPLALTIPPAPRGLEQDRPDARLIVNATGGTVRFEGREISLARREFDLLVALANEAAIGGGFVDHDALYAAIQGSGSPGEIMVYEEQIAKSISTLRKVMADAAGLSDGERKALVENKRKVGYRLVLGPSDILVN
jgi:DNA-binding winged helix-turn-helix (wHTH) protein